MEYTLTSAKENKTIGKAILDDKFESLTITIEEQYKKIYEGVILAVIKSVNQQGNFRIEVHNNETGTVVKGISKDIWLAIKQNLLINSSVIMEVNKAT